MSWTEGLGFVAGAASVWLFVRQRMTAWPVGIANSVFWIFLFWGSRLYFDAGLQVLYVVLGLLGWYWWFHGTSSGADLAVIHPGKRETAVLVAAALAGTGALWFTQARWTDGALPFWDASTTVVSLVAQYMLTRKLFENWWLWIAVDVAYVGMYVSQHLYLTAGLQPIFIYLCIRGIRDWRASMTSGSSPATAIVAIEP